MATITIYLKNYSKFSDILVKFGTKLITSMFFSNRSAKWQHFNLMTKRPRKFPTSF